MKTLLYKTGILGGLICALALQAKAQDKLVDYYGSFRVNTSDNRMSGNVLNNDTTSERRGSGGDFVFDLGIKIQPNENFRANAILRSATTIGDNSANTQQLGTLTQAGIITIFRQVKVEGLIKDKVRYEIGDIDVKLSPYTLVNGQDLFTTYEADVFRQRRSVLTYENFNIEDNWRLQGFQSATNLRLGKAIDKLGIKAFATRVRPSNETDQQDRFVFGTQLLADKNKNIQVGLNYVTLFDNVGSSADTIEKYANHVLTGSYDIAFPTQNFRFSLEGESGISANQYFIETLNTTSESNDFFVDLGINVAHEKSGITLETAYLNVGPNFTSPGAQTLRIQHTGSPYFFPTLANNSTARNINMMDRLTDINLYNQQLSTGLMYYQPIFGNVLPYGKATPNRQGITIGLGHQKDSKKLVKVNLNAALLSEITGEGTTELRQFTQLKGGAICSLGQLLSFKKKIELSLGVRQESTTRTGSAQVDFSSLMIDAGATIETIHKLDLLIGAKYLIGQGNESLTNRDAFNNIIGFTSYDIDMDQIIFAAGARVNFFKNAYASIDYNRFVLTDLKDVTNDYNWGNLFMNFWFKF